MKDMECIAVDGVKYWIALPHRETDYIQSKIAKEKTPYEHSMLNDIASRLDDGEVVIDVGANIGNHSLYLSALKGCRVHAFEPNKELCDAIKRSAEANGLANRLTVYNMGVGAQRGRAHFAHFDESNLGAQSLEIGSQDQDTIDIICLDDLQWGDRVQVIKIDVEGMELDVLKGAVALIERDQPYLYVECQGKEDFVNIHNWLVRLGYGYLDTFNATPTHLFAHQSRLNFEQQIEKTLHKLQYNEYELKERLVSLKERLNEANKKYRLANENIDKLKENLRNANEGIKNKGLQIEKLKLELECARVNNMQEQEALSKKLKEKEHEIDLQKEEYILLHEALSNLEANHDGVKREVDDLKSHHVYARSSHSVLRDQIDFLRKLLEDEKTCHKSEREALLHKGREREQLYLKVREELLELERRHVSDQAYIKVLENKIEEISKKKELLEEKILLIGERQKELGSQKNEAARNVFELEENNKRLLNKLDEANKKYREVTASQIPLLKNRLNEESRRTRELHNRVEQLNTELKRVKGQYALAERRLSELRASLTYKSGLYFRAAASSWRDALKLPVRLLRLMRQSRRRNAYHISAEGEKSKESESREVFTAKHEVEKLDVSALLSKPAKQIRVACIMDDFTFGSYRPECDLHQLTPEHWAAELQACQPELLFIESAWRGKEELWGSKVGHTSLELQEIVAWCRKRHIPTIFWNKEDPVHFETFLNTARIFDYVFTTDIDCIHRYKAALGHERVYFLPFACQPAVHNPIEKYQRQDAFCFAGAYYVRYPERTRDLESFIQELPSFRPLQIYDRNYGKSDPNYQFPEAYRPHIVGTLPFEQIDKAYKGYRYAINLNSIKQSQTMFARRVYELLGSNTLTVSNFSRGVRLMFGDLVVTSDSGAEVKRRLKQLQEDGSVDRLRLAGVRKAMREHTYAERFAYVLSKVSGRKVSVPLPSFKVLATANTITDVERLVSHVERQSGVEVSLSVVLRRGVSMEQAMTAVASAACQVELLPAKALRRKQLCDLADEAAWIAGMLPQDYYGAHYLLDIALATRYSDAQVIGKAAYHSWQHGECKLHNANEAYRPANHLMARRAAITVTAAKRIRVDKWLAGMKTWRYESLEQLAIDAYNYCESCMEGDSVVVAKAVDDLQVNAGISLEELIELAESVAPMESSSDGMPYFDGRELVHVLSGKPFTFLTGHEPREDDGQGDGPVTLSRNKALTFNLEGSVLEIGSKLPDGKHEYVYATSDIDCKVLAELLSGIEPGMVPLHMEVEPGLNLSLVVLFLDQKKQRIGHVIEQSNRNNLISLPEGTAFLRFGLRIYAGGNARIKRLLLGHLDLEPANILGQSHVLLLSNHYPSYDDLYRNGFVHSRVRAYQERGVHVDIFRLRKDQPISWHEFQNIDVTTGSQEALRRMLASGRYRHVLVHFLDPDMWEVLKDFIDNTRVTVWVHGAEIHPWYRRKFNIETPEQEEIERKKSEERMAFWRSILNPMPENLHLVFVSKTFSEEVMEDIGFELPSGQYSIIHNPIDTKLFNYMKKSDEQRKKILSIRPYATRQYANDVAVKVILELSNYTEFQEMEFSMIGDGKLFDETLEPIKGYDNVHIERRFMTQTEIAALHKEYGLFLCPSRWDSQGVSRDEAMASGLVPITNTVAAIPEFVDEDSGVLASAENAERLAQEIISLYNDPNRFETLSRNAAARVRVQSDKNLVIEQEINIFAQPLEASTRSLEKLV